MPPQTWVFSDFPKTSQNIQLLATCLPSWKLYLSSLHQNFSPNLLPKFSMSSFGCVPFILYGIQESPVWNITSLWFIMPLCKSTLNRMSHPFLDLVCASKPTCPSIIGLLDRCTPSLVTCHLPCEIFLCLSLWLLVDVSMRSFNLFDAPMLSRVDESTPWACSQVAPPFPKCNPSLRQSFQGM